MNKLIEELQRLLKDAWYDDDTMCVNGDTLAEILRNALVAQQPVSLKWLKIDPGTHYENVLLKNNTQTYYAKGTFIGYWAIDVWKYTHYIPVQSLLVLDKED